MDIEGFEYEVVRRWGHGCEVVIRPCAMACGFQLAHVMGRRLARLLQRARSAYLPICIPRLCCVQVSGFVMEDSCHFPHQISLEVHYKGLYLLTPFYKVRRAGRGRDRQEAGSPEGRAGFGLDVALELTTAQPPLPRLLSALCRSATNGATCCGPCTS